MIKTYKRQLERARQKSLELEQAFEKLGGPGRLTYFGGWDAGYLRGKISALEDIIYDLEGDDHSRNY